MAGGNFDINVGKTRPGTYVNVKSKKQQKAKQYKGRSEFQAQNNSTELGIPNS